MPSGQFGPGSSFFPHSHNQPQHVISMVYPLLRWASHPNRSEIIYSPPGLAVFHPRVGSGCRHPACLLPKAPTWPATPCLDTAAAPQQAPILPRSPPPPSATSAPRSQPPRGAQVDLAGRGGRRPPAAVRPRANLEAARRRRGLGGPEKGPTGLREGSVGTPRCKIWAFGWPRGTRRAAGKSWARRLPGSGARARAVGRNPEGTRRGGSAPRGGGRRRAEEASLWRSPADSARPRPSLATATATATGGGLGGRRRR